MKKQRNLEKFLMPFLREPWQRINGKSCVPETLRWWHLMKGQHLRKRQCMSVPKMMMSWGTTWRGIAKCNADVAPISALHTGRGKYYSMSDGGGLPKETVLCKGARVRLLSNEWKEAGKPDWFESLLCLLMLIIQLQAWSMVPLEQLLALFMPQERPHQDFHIVS